MLKGISNANSSSLASLLQVQAQVCVKKQPPFPQCLHFVSQGSDPKKSKKYSCSQQPVTSETALSGLTEAPDTHRKSVLPPRGSRKSQGAKRPGDSHQVSHRAEAEPSSSSTLYSKFLVPRDYLSDTGYADLSRISVFMVCVQRFATSLACSL